jgi:hypothetical protein
MTYSLWFSASSYVYVCMSMTVGGFIGRYDCEIATEPLPRNGRTHDNVMVYCVCKAAAACCQIRSNSLVTSILALRRYIA